MDILIAILIFLGALSPNDNLNKEQLDELKNQNNSQIEVLKIEWDEEDWD